MTTNKDSVINAQKKKKKHTCKTGKITKCALNLNV